MNTRTDWIDFAKGLGIVLVVYGHTLRGLASADIIPDGSALLASDYVIYTFHMPLFFFLAGLTAYPSIAKGRGRFLRGKVSTILYPYVLWSLLQGGVEVALSEFTNSPTEASRLLEIPWDPISPFWFLYSLFWIHLIFAALHRTGPIRVLALSAVAFVVSWFLAPQIVFDTARGFLYYAAGTALWAHMPEGVRPRPGTLVAITALLAVLFLLSALASLGLGIDDQVAVVPALLGIAFTAGLGLRLAERLPWVVWLGTMSMSIYVMHILATAGLRILLSNGLGIENPLVLLPLGTAAGVLLPLAAHVVASRLGIAGLLALPVANGRHREPRGAR
jgi:fucose 4-O-acetylase-like acetyltransferase